MLSTKRTIAGPRLMGRGAQSGQTLRERDAVLVGCAFVWAGFRDVVGVPPTIAECGPDWLFCVCLPVVDADAVLLVVDRGGAFGLADARRGAGGVGDASVGTSRSSGVASFIG
ncbi:hypothetical protein [Thiocapsa sp.]|uniref:hypothetical protein n=1 Tax=Thiocapsa sp. TaxID=2024551 RepID=UPI0025D3D604|nr:hypothetical protein [Thiocapsa sp.]